MPEAAFHPHLPAHTRLNIAACSFWGLHKYYAIRVGSQASAFCSQLLQHPLNMALVTEVNHETDRQTQIQIPTLQTRQLGLTPADIT